MMPFRREAGSALSWVLTHGTGESRGKIQDSSPVG
jgi:hypothetical protein